jgi:hypothetical protein
MTGEQRQFVVEWEEHSLNFLPFSKIWTAEDWYARPVAERHFNCLVMWGRDELDVYTQLFKAEEQTSNA